MGLDPLASLHPFVLLHQGFEAMLQPIDLPLLRRQLAAERIDGVLEQGDLALELDAGLGHAAIIEGNRHGRNRPRHRRPVSCQDCCRPRCHGARAGCQVPRLR